MLMDKQQHESSSLIYLIYCYRGWTLKKPQRAQIQSSSPEDFYPSDLIIVKYPRIILKNWIKLLKNVCGIKTPMFENVHVNLY